MDFFLISKESAPAILLFSSKTNLFCRANFEPKLYANLNLLHFVFCAFLNIGSS